MRDEWANRVLEYLRTADSHAAAFPVPEVLTKCAREFYIDLTKSVSILSLISTVVIFADNAVLVSAKIIEIIE
jgi:hypothetical protein